MHAKIRHGAILRYPYGIDDFAADYPTTSPPSDFAAAVLPDAEIVVVVVTGAPAETEEAAPTYSAERERWEQTWATKCLKGNMDCHADLPGDGRTLY